MNSILKLVEKYEAENPPIKHRFGKQTCVRLYNLVKPLKDGECTINTYAAFNSRRKGGGLKVKLVFSVNTRTGRYRHRDLLWYSSWSTMAHDHWCVDCSEYGLYNTNYFTRTGRKDEKGKWFTGVCSQTLAGELNFPTVTMLSGFEGTKYKYCAYQSWYGVNPYEYISLFNIDSRIELLSKAGLDRFINNEFISYFKDDADFAKWFVKNWKMVKEKCKSNKGVFRKYGNELHSETLKRQNLERERIRRRERIKAERERIERRYKDADQYADQIRKLFNRLKNICKQYKAYEVIIPKSGREMVDEGTHMHNCIGDIHPQYQGVSECCIFLHKEGKPFLDISVDLKTFEVTECRLVNNKEAKKKYWRDARSIAKMVREEYRKAA